MQLEGDLGLAGNQQTLNLCQMQTKKDIYKLFSDLKSATFLQQILWSLFAIWEKVFLANFHLPLCS